MPAPAAAILLEELAKLIVAEAGKRLAKEIAEKFINLVFGHLATKDDLKNAVKEIERFVDQKFDDLRMDELKQDVYAAQSFLDRYRSVDQSEVDSAGALRDFANHAVSKCVESKSRIDVWAEREPYVRGRIYPIIAKYVAIDIASTMALIAVSPSTYPHLAERTFENKRLVENVVSDIIEYEVPKIVEVYTEGKPLPPDVGDGGLPGRPGAGPRAFEFTVNVKTWCGREGERVIRKGHIFYGIPLSDSAEFKRKVTAGVQEEINAKMAVLDPIIQPLIDVISALDKGMIATYIKLEKAARQ